MNTPPPLPGARAQGSLYRQAAAAALIAPLLAIAIALVFNVTDKDTTPRTTLMIGAGVSALLLFAGLVCAIIALCGIPRHGRRGLLIRGIIGLGLNGVMVAALIFTAVVAAGRSAQTSREAWSDFQSAARDLGTGLRTNYSSETGLTNDLTRQMGEFQSRIESAAKSARGDDALIMQATAAMTAQTQAKLKVFSAATDALVQAQVANLSTLTDKSQIEDRRKRVNNFITANKSLKEFLARQDKVVEAELLARHLPPAKVQTFLAAFRTSQVALLPKVAAIRACDDQIGQSLLKILDIAEAQWGNWEYDPETQLTLFKEGSAADAYNEQAQAIEQVAARQIQLQGEVLKLQERAAGAREGLTR